MNLSPEIPRVGLVVSVLDGVVVLHRSTVEIVQIIRNFDVQTFTEDDHGAHDAQIHDGTDLGESLDDHVVNVFFGGFELVFWLLGHGCDTSSCDQDNSDAVNHEPETLAEHDGRQDSGEDDGEAGRAADQQDVREL